MRLVSKCDDCGAIVIGDRCHACNSSKTTSALVEEMTSQIWYSIRSADRIIDCLTTTFEGESAVVLRNHEMARVVLAAAINAVIFSFTQKNEISQLKEAANSLIIELNEFTELPPEGEEKNDLQRAVNIFRESLSKLREDIP